MLDSIVDSFFPFLEEIGREVMDVESLVFDSLSTLYPTDIPEHRKSVEARQPAEVSKSLELPTADPSPEPDEKPNSSRPSSPSPKFIVPRAPGQMTTRRIRRNLSAFKTFVNSSIKKVFSRKKTAQNETGLQLRRIARTRKLVTSLTRLLAAKSEVVARIRKRLLTDTSMPGLGNGVGRGEDVDLAIYMGDVQG